MIKTGSKMLVSFALCLGLALPTAQGAAAIPKNYWGTALAAAAATYFVGNKISSDFKKAKEKSQRESYSSGKKTKLSFKKFCSSRYFPKAFLLKASAAVFGIFCLEAFIMPTTPQEDGTPASLPRTPDRTPQDRPIDQPFIPRTPDALNPELATPINVPAPEDFFPEYDPSLFDFDHRTPERTEKPQHPEAHNNHQNNFDADELDAVLLASLAFEDIPEIITPPPTHQPLQIQEPVQASRVPAAPQIQFIDVLQQTADRGFAECGYHATRNAILLAQNNSDLNNRAAYEQFFTQNQPQNAIGFYANLLSAEDMFDIVRNAVELSPTQKNSVVVFPERARELNETFDNSLGNLIDVSYEGSMEKTMIDQIDAFQKAQPGARLIVIARARSEHWVALRCRKNTDQSLNVEVADSGESKISQDEINDILTVVTHQNMSAAYALTSN